MIDIDSPTSLLTISGAKNSLVLDPEGKRVFVFSSVGNGFPGAVATDQMLVLATIPNDVVPDTLRSWLGREVVQVVLQDIASQYLGAVWDRQRITGRWGENTDEMVSAFADCFTEAIQLGLVGRFWDAEAWCSGDWEPCLDGVRRMGLDEWCENEVAEGKRNGAWLDAQALRRAVTGRAEVILARYTDPVLVEVVPEALRASHEAAQNMGVYPANGAERLVCDRGLADLLVDGTKDSEFEWVRVLRDATLDDLLAYGGEP